MCMREYLSTGSSPRMRGTHIQRVLGFDGQGIIPADAGNTLYFARHHTREQDHPSGCGEHQRGCAGTTRLRGSSPRMRGTHIEIIDGVMHRRIIPADAGNTSGKARRRARRRDHPRGCGEHTSMSKCDWVSMGSSPRMRGTLGRTLHPPESERIIPADAGNT